MGILNKVPKFLELYFFWNFIFFRDVASELQTCYCSTWPELVPTALCGAWIRKSAHANTSDLSGHWTNNAQRNRILHFPKSYNFPPRAPAQERQNPKPRPKPIRDSVQIENEFVENLGAFWSCKTPCSGCFQNKAPNCLELYFWNCQNLSCFGGSPK